MRSTFDTFSKLQKVLQKVLHFYKNILITLHIIVKIIFSHFFEFYYIIQ